MLSKPTIDEVDSSEPSADAVMRLGRRRLMTEEMDITPMIDITFLLLIFFIVASNLNADPILLPPATHGLAVSSRDCVVVVVRRGSGRNVEVLRGDNFQPFSSNLDQQEAEVTQYVLDALAADGGKSQVMIMGEAGVRFGEIQRVRLLLSEALEPGQNINIAVLQQS